jgi:alkylation response protein AidB-like acyl-CoA dehydrogenase
MFDPNDNEMRMLAGAADDFARKELAPEREEHDRFPYGPFFQPVLDKAYELDFFHILLPEKLGGTGLGVRALCVVLNRIAREDASLAAVILTHTFAQQILLEAGMEELVGEMNAAADSLSSLLLACPLFNDPGQVRHLANVTDGRLEGRLEYLVLGGIAARGLIPAANGSPGGYAFLLADLAGNSVTLGDPVLSHGLHACPAVDAVFSAATALPVGDPASGGLYFTAAADLLLLAPAAIGAGIMRGALDEALHYAEMREQGGRTIIDWSEVEMILADMAYRLQVAEMVVEKACDAVEAGAKNWRQQVRSAAVQVEKTAVKVASSGMQILGGVGYMKDFGQEKRFRDARQLKSCMGLAPLKKLALMRKPHR